MNKVGGFFGGLFTFLTGIIVGTLFGKFLLDRLVEFLSGRIAI